MEVLVAAWGNADAFTYYPEFRIFSTSQENSDIIMQSATVMIDGNMYELTMAELVLDSSHGANFYLTSDAESFVKSLASNKSFSIILRHSGGTVSFSMFSDEMRTVSQFAYDLLAIDYLNHIAGSEAANEAQRKEATPITSYVFNEILLEEQPDAQANAETPAEAADEWKGHTIQKMGVTIYLPSSFIVYTHGMSADDPAVISSGLTPEEIDEALDEQSCVMIGSADGFNTEVRAGKTDSSFGDFSFMSEWDLRELFSVWPAIYKMMGYDVYENDIFTSGDMKYFRMRERFVDSDESGSHWVQYYTVMNKQAYSFVYSKASGELTEDELRFMQNVVERVEFGGGENEERIIADEGDMREYVLEDGPFTVTLDASKYNILVPGMSTDDPALVRSGLIPSSFDSYMSILDKSLLMFDINEKMPASCRFSIRIKDKKYEGIDMATDAAADAISQLNMIYLGFEGTGASNKEIVYINDVPYLKFDFMGGTQKRYATIVNEDMIYIWAECDSGTVTEKDTAILLEIVESIKYPGKA